MSATCRDATSERGEAHEPQPHQNPIARAKNSPSALVDFGAARELYALAIERLPPSAAAKTGLSAAAIRSVSPTDATAIWTVLLEDAVRTARLAAVRSGDLHLVHETCPRSSGESERHGYGPDVESAREAWRAVGEAARRLAIRILAGG